MPNRFLKESICSSETIALLTADEERFFYRLIVQCDDYGRLDARPRILRTKLFPLQLDTVSDEDIAQWLQKLARVSLIIIFINNNKPYLQITTWHKYQQTRAKYSKYPAHDSNDSNILAHDSICYQTLSDVSICARITYNDKRITNNDINNSLDSGNHFSSQLLEKHDLSYPHDNHKTDKDIKQAVNLQDINDKSLPVPNKKTGKRKINVTNKNTEKKKIPVKKENTEAMELASQLANLILKNNPKARITNLLGWARDIDLMIRVDNRTPQEIAEIIDFSQKDEFWHKNILSGATLREKYDRLYLEKKSKGNGHSDNAKVRQDIKTNYQETDSELSESIGKPLFPAEVQNLS